MCLVEWFFNTNMYNDVVQGENVICRSSFQNYFQTIIIAKPRTNKGEFEL